MTLAEEGITGLAIIDIQKHFNLPSLCGWLIDKVIRTR